MSKTKTAASYEVVVKNRPGELLKLTERLAKEGLTLGDLRVMNLGKKAAIHYSALKEAVPPPRLRRLARLAVPGSLKA